LKKNYGTEDSRKVAKADNDAGKALKALIDKIDALVAECKRYKLFIWPNTF